MGRTLNSLVLPALELFGTVGLLASGDQSGENGSVESVLFLNHAHFHK